MTRPSDDLLLSICAAAGLVCLLTIGGYVNSPLRADEADFPAQARAIVAHGVPRVDFSEDHLQHPGHLLGYGAHYGMWHPPLYQYTLALAYLAAGDRDWVYRGVGVICLVLTMLIVYAMTRPLVGSASGAARLLPLAVPLLSPLVVDGSLFIDIDNTTLMTSIALVLWRFLRPGDPYSLPRVIELALLLCLMLLSKLTTPIVVMASLGLYAALGPRPVRGVLAIAIASVAGVTLFAALYWTYCAALDYPARFMFDVSYLGKKQLYGSAKALRDVLFAVRWNVVWVSPVILLLLGSVTLRRTRRYWRERVPEPVDLFIIVSWATFVCYAILGAMWGKYTVPAALFGAVAIGIELANAGSVLDIDRPRPLVFALVGLAVAASALPVPYARPGLADPSRGMIDLVLDPRNVTAAVTTVLAASIAVVAARRWLRAGGRWRAWEVALAATLAAVVPVTSARVVLPAYDSGPLRPSSDRGFRATVDYLNRNAPPNTAIVAQKEFAQYFRGRVFPLSDLLEPGDVSRAVSAARRPDVRFIVDSARYPVVLQRGLFEALDIARVDAVDDFRIYVKR